MSISERQLELIQGAAKLLMKDLLLTQEEAVQLVLTSLKRQLVAKNLTIEAINSRSRSDRTAFIRAVVHDLQSSIENNSDLRPKNLARTIESFYKILHDSWTKEEGGEI